MKETTMSNAINNEKTETVMKVVRGKYNVTITTNTPSQKAMNNFNAQLGKLLFKYATE